MCVIIWRYRTFRTAHFIEQAPLHPANLVLTGFNGSSCVLAALTVGPVLGLPENSLLPVTVLAEFSLSFKVRITFKGKQRRATLLLRCSFKKKTMCKIIVYGILDDINQDPVERGQAAFLRISKRNHLQT